MKDTAQAIRRLLQRNPDVQVYVRGPHATGSNMFCLQGDYHADRCFRVLREEFKDLRDQVVLLNAWDMTVANENFDIHPSAHVRNTLCRMVLSHVCRQ